MIKRILIMILIIGISIVIIGCQSVKDFYDGHREMIQDVITIILDTIFEQIQTPNVNTPSGDNSGSKIPSSIPLVKSNTVNNDYINELKLVLHDPKFWEKVNDRVGVILEKERVK